MTKLLLFGTFVLFMQSYLSADASNIFLSKENANSFLQKKSRNRRSVYEGVWEECCLERCEYEEKREFVEENGYNNFYDAVCELSILEKRSCTCKAHAGYLYECGSYVCKDRACGCAGKKDPKKWEVIGVSYDTPRGSLKQRLLDTSTKDVDNLKGEIKIEPSYSYSATVAEGESFTHTVGTELSVGATFSAGVPLVAEAEISTTLSVKTEHEFGKTTSKSTTKTVTMPCPAPPKRYVICHGLVKMQEMSVPYTMTLKNKLFGCTCTSKGVYKNVKSTGFYVKAITYTSKPSGDEVEDEKLMEGRSQFVEDRSQFAEDGSQFGEDQSQLTVN